jgi:hypothetical protein
MKPRRRRLSLGKETLRRLDGNALARVAGGAIEPPGHPTLPPSGGPIASALCPTSGCWFTVLCTVTCSNQVCGNG